MTDEENKETSEETPAEEPQADETPQDESTEETPAEATPAAPGSDAEEAAADGEAPPSADDDHDLTPSEEAEGPDTEAESPTEEPSAQEEPPAEESEAAQEEAPAEEAKAEKKKDVIPGADLEPIAVDSGEERPLSAEERARREAEEEERAQREAELVGGVVDEESSAASRAPAKMESGARFQATGKRKRSIARVTLLPGDGKFEINGRTIEEFFPRPLHQTMAKQPLATTGYETSVDVRIRVHGGGIGGQAGAVRHGISRALTEIDPELRGELKRRGFLTRDARVKERRKAGLKKARKRPQFSKR
jgi:small subunit ribosomal protein S9